MASASMNNASRDPVDLNSIFDDLATVLKGTAFMEASVELAKELLPGLQRLKELGKEIASSPRMQCVMFYTAAKQVAEGKIPSINYGIVEEVETFTKEIVRLRSSYGSMTCYPEVIEMRRRLDAIQKECFPVLERMMELVDFHSVSKKVPAAAR